MKELTGKKVVLVAHSLGNLATHSILTKMSTIQKDELIAHWLALGPPFRGAAKVSEVLIGGNKDFVFPMGFGIHFPA